jgi:hypothetical protein
MAMHNPLSITVIDPTADAPRALLSEVWRRVDRSIDRYFVARNIARPKEAAALERFLESEPGMGKAVADDMRALRAQYDRIEHSRTAQIPNDEAKQFVARAVSVMRVLRPQGPNAV